MCQEQRILDLLVEFHKRGDELRNERSANLSLVETDGKGEAQMIRVSCSVGEGGDTYEPAKVLWFGCLEEILCNGDDLILYALFNFKPLERLEYWGNVKMFGSASNGTCKSILDMLKAFDLSNGLTVIHGVTVIEA